MCDVKLYVCIYKNAFDDDSTHVLSKISYNNLKQHSNTTHLAIAMIAESSDSNSKHSKSKLIVFNTHPGIMTFSRDVLHTKQYQNTLHSALL